MIPGEHIKFPIVPQRKSESLTVPNQLGLFNMTRAIKDLMKIMVQ